MSDRRSTIIESWFASCPEDGDFVRYDDGLNYVVVEPAEDDDPFVYTTKPASVELAIRDNSSGGCGMIGRYGLPNSRDIEWFVDLLESRTVYFLGDMDPADLMILAWLREQMSTIRIQHLGVSDAYIAAVGVTIPDTYTIELSKSERDSLAVLETSFPDYREAVGGRCAKLLADGRKIEIEAVASSAGSVSDLLRPIAQQS